jgi:RND family efflux transporter MFP subunit
LRAKSSDFANEGNAEKRMKRAYWSIWLAFALTFTACGTASPAAAPSTVAPTAATGSSGPGSVTATAEAIPAKLSEMGFVISGRVKEVDVKAGDEVGAGQTLVVLDTPDLQSDLGAAKAELKSATANDIIQRTARKTWTGDKFVWQNGAPEWRQKADARLVQAQAGLDYAQANLGQGTLVAPFGGIVVKINVVPGEFVQPEDVVVVIADLHHLQIKTKDLSERDIARVHVGQAATVHLKAFSQDLSGKVTVVSPLGEEYKGDIVYKVTIELDAPPAGLLWGMTGDVDIQTQ